MFPGFSVEIEPLLRHLTAREMVRLNISVKSARSRRQPLFPETLGERPHSPRLRHGGDQPGQGEPPYPPLALPVLRMSAFQ